MLLREETKCFAFLAGHESFAAAEGAIGIAMKANKVRKDPLQVILNGLGKDAAKSSAVSTDLLMFRPNSIISQANSKSLTRFLTAPAKEAK